jgi:spore germination cell wall hydrolase CwlJ-like protein
MDDRFPGTICEVVYQPKQFSWTIKKKSKLNRIDMDVMHAYYYGPRVNALYYHNDKVRPKWAKKLNKLKQEGSHTFYK